MSNAIKPATAGDYETEEKVMKKSERMNEPRKQKKETLREKLQKHMAAVAYAEAGEFGVAKDLVEPSSKTRTVLLVIEGPTPDPASFDYALNLCKRTKAELDILQVIDSDSEHDYESLSRRMADGSRHIVDMVRKLEADDVPFKVTIRIGDANQKLFNYAKRHKDVGVVVFDSPKAKQSSQGNKGWSGLVDEISRRLSIPLVTVVEGTS
jgi:hypothetical protein